MVPPCLAIECVDIYKYIGSILSLTSSLEPSVELPRLKYIGQWVFYYSPVGNPLS